MDEAIDRLRAICLALPEATERETWDDPTWRVRDRIFALGRFRGERPALWCKAQPELRDALVATDPGRHFVPPYVGQHGWLGIWLDDGVDWDAVAEHIAESYRRTAPKRLAALLDRP